MLLRIAQPVRFGHVRLGRHAPKRQSTLSSFIPEVEMDISPMLFVCLFLAGPGIFFMGSAAIWWVSLQAAAMKSKAAAADRS